MKQDQIILFNYEDFLIRVVTLDNGEPGFVARDVAKVLEHSDVSMMVRNLDDDEYLTQTLFVSGQNRNVIILLESGLYTVLIRSNKPQAKPFRRWVTHEVLPAIRKTGSYSLPGREQPDALSDITIKLLADETDSAFNLFRKYVVTGNEGQLEINATIRFRFDTDLTESSDITELASDKSEEYLTPTELGKKIGCSAKKVNKLLLEKGLQISFRDAKGELCYEPTEKGTPYAVFGDTGKKPFKTKRTKRLLWKKFVIILIS